MIAKTSQIRLTGKPLAELNAEIHARDNNSCVCCGRWVDPGEKWHHEPGGANKQDRIECGATVCGRCHHERHFGKLLRMYRELIERYLRELYPEFWEARK